MFWGKGEGENERQLILQWQYLFCGSTIGRVSRVRKRGKRESTGGGGKKKKKRGGINVTAVRCSVEPNPLTRCPSNISPGNASTRRSGGEASGERVRISNEKKKKKERGKKNRERAIAAFNDFSIHSRIGGTSSLKR